MLLKIFSKFHLLIPIFICQAQKHINRAVHSVSTRHVKYHTFKVYAPLSLITTSSNQNKWDLLLKTENLAIASGP